MSNLYKKQRSEKKQTEDARMKLNFYRMIIWESGNSLSIHHTTFSFVSCYEMCWVLLEIVPTLTYVTVCGFHKMQRNSSWDFCQITVTTDSRGNHCTLCMSCERTNQVRSIFRLILSKCVILNSCWYSNLLFAHPVSLAHHDHFDPGPTFSSILFLFVRFSIVPFLGQWNF